jgi:hypothetical protein
MDLDAGTWYLHESFFHVYTLSLHTFPQNWTHNPNDLPELQGWHTDSVFTQVKIDLAVNPVKYFLVGNTQGMKTETTVALYVVEIYRNSLVHPKRQTFDNFAVSGTVFSSWASHR